MAIDYCLKNDIMTDYLTDNESEVINMFGFEWNEEDERKEQAAAFLEAERTRIENEQRDSAAELHETYQDIYSAEKAKERAKMEVYAEFKEKERKKQKEAIKGAANSVKKLLLWAVTVFLLLMTVASIAAIPQPVYIFSTIIFFMLAVAACPFITEKIRQNEKYKVYCEHKKLIVVLLIIALFADIIILG